MAKVFFGGGMFIVEALTGGLSSASGAGWELTSGGLALMVLGALPTACAVANGIFGGSPEAESLADAIQGFHWPRLE